MKLPVKCLAVLSAVLLLAANGAWAQTPLPDPCADLDSADCLAAVRALMADEGRYWFGTAYASACAGAFGGFSNPTCANADPQHLSIVTRLRGSGDSQVDGILQVLNVTFQAPAGTYESCGNTYHVDAVTQTINPVETTPIPLWSANHRPRVTWRSEADKLYSLIVWDAGAVFLHAAVVNINGSDSHLGQTVYNYRGPKNSQARDQPYAFLLYEQNGTFSDSAVRDDILARLQANINLSPKALVDAFSLQGPVGVSVLTVNTDPFAVGYMKQSRILNNCPAILTPKFSALPLSYNVTGVRLTSSVDVMFTSPAITVRSCCTEVHVVANSRVPNPLADGRISPVYTRFAPHVTLVPPTFFDQFYYYRARYTLLMVDVTDELSGTPAASADVLVHWQVANIQEGELASGDTALPYLAPLPLAVGGGGDGGRVVMFLLLKQSSRVDASSLAGFTGGEACGPRMRNRCRFNMTAFLTDLQMTVDGASWFVTSPDAYSRQQAVRQGVQGNRAACRGAPGYEDPCPPTSCPTGTGTAPRAHASSTAVLAVVTSALVVLAFWK